MDVAFDSIEQKDCFTPEALFREKAPFRNPVVLCRSQPASLTLLKIDLAGVSCVRSTTDALSTKTNEQL